MFTQLKMAASRISFIGKCISELNTPAFLVDKKIVIRNCDRMIKRCQELGVSLRPHSKTHKTVEGSTLQTGGTKRKIVACTLNDAQFFSQHGFDDILYGFPLLAQHIPRCASLANKLDEFHVMVDNGEVVKSLTSSTLLQPGKKWSVFIKINAGNNRAGIWWEDTEKIVQVASLVANSKTAKFQGIYLHCGDSYYQKTHDTVLEVRKNGTTAILSVAETLEKAGIPCKTFGIGSTPSCSMDFTKSADGNLARLTEAHPGNYIFYDAQQESIGSCTFDDLACRVMTRVIGHYPSANYMLIDCGFTALTKQGFNLLKTPGFSVIQGEPNLKVTALTQEIGKVEAIDGKLDYSKYPVGSPLFLYPYHVCATAAMHPVYYVHEGDKVIEEWIPTRGW
ncbi:D-serine dehydratase-like isoform X2 [Bacillus rossius redtenbacheri]|uniref:D-serine dehydratase-like isoform X2 n=1 Tax=Bacillus rossius redtenbacheri TaxID=93214 RepID=UPI002FDCC08C